MRNSMPSDGTVGWWPKLQSILSITPAIRNLSTPVAPVLDCSQVAFSSLLPSNAKINYATVVPANGTFHEPSPPFPNPSTGLPELCALSVTVVSSPSSSYDFGLFLPQEWNSRLMGVGNGGFGGGLNWGDMGTNAMQGFVSMSTDTGHRSAVTDASWAAGNEETRKDWGYRAMHGSVELAKTLAKGYYGTKVQWSYYSSCSTGGRQGLKEIQKYPTDFDGLIIAAPAWWTSRLQPWSQQVSLWNLPVASPHHIPSNLFPLVAAEVLKQCDPQDGLTDSIISSPSTCAFHPESLLCSSHTSKSKCLTAPQINTLKKLYQAWTTSNSDLIFPGFSLGAEAQYVALANTDSGVPSRMGSDWILNFLLNISSTSPQGQNYDWSGFNHSTVQLADALNPGGANADDFDLSPFASRGGKMIMYHGLSDGLIPAGSSVYFYEQVLSTLIPKGINVSDFYKFYLVPGMLHCSGSVGDAPWYFNGGTQGFSLGPGVSGVPGFDDERHDVLKALMAWVEEGKAPKEIVATKYLDEKIDSGVRRQRPICEYPGQAKWKGEGDVDQEGSWECRGVYGELV